MGSFAAQIPTQFTVVGVIAIFYLEDTGEKKWVVDQAKVWSSSDIYQP